METIIEKLNYLNNEIVKIENQVENEPVGNTDLFFLKLKLLDAIKQHRDVLSEICVYMGYNPITGINIDDYKNNHDNNSKSFRADYHREICQEDDV